MAFSSYDLEDEDENANSFFANDQTGVLLVKPPDSGFFPDSDQQKSEARKDASGGEIDGDNIENTPDVDVGDFFFG